MIKNQTNQKVLNVIQANSAYFAKHAMQDIK